MNVITFVAHAEAVALPLVEREHGLDHFHGVRIRSTIDRPAIEAAIRRVVLGEYHVENMVGLRNSCDAPNLV